MKRKGEFSYSTRRKIVIAIAVAILGFLYLFRNLSFIILAGSAIALIVLFHLVDAMFDIRFKPIHYFFIVFIAIFSFLFSNFYLLYPNYDKVLHFIQPVMLSSIAFYMMSDLDLKLKWKLTFTFFVVVGGIGLFEIGEYALDSFFDLNLQGVFRQVQELGELIVLQDRIDDTMIDMALGVGGAIVYVISILGLSKRKRIY